MSKLPSYRVDIVPFQAKTPKVGNPASVTQEIYDQWIASEDHIRMEERADAGKLWFWAAKITEFHEGQDKTVEVHSTPFDTEYATGHTKLKDFLQDVSQAVRKRAKDIMGEDERRIIRP